jgi:hypothetical protein
MRPEVVIAGMHTWMPKVKVIIENDINNDSDIDNDIDDDIDNDDYDMDDDVSREYPLG